MDVNVKVAVRCRPMSSKETARGCNCVIKMTNNNIRVIPPEGGAAAERDFTFDNCYFTESTQCQVYKELGLPIVNQALDGFNGTMFAYGQTGSGKTFTMMGVGTNDNSQKPPEEEKDDNSPWGIIPRLNLDLFRRLDILMAKTASEKVDKPDIPETKFLVSVTFLEIYNEILKDLLNPADKPLKIRENSELGIYVEGLCELVVHSHQDVMRLLEQGNTVRRVAATNMNEQSSRSHSCFTIKIQKKTITELDGGITREQLLSARINLVDLAGSERAAKTGASGSTLKEGANINLSLMALGNVINALSEKVKGKNASHIPYRDSKLTRLLQESLGGNAATLMLAAISPADYNIDETVSTLKYAHRAKCIEQAVVRNENVQDKMIRDLQAQIEALKNQLATAPEGAAVQVTAQDSKAQEELKEKLESMEKAQQNAWEEQERLSKALEHERQDNMSTVISSMMQDVKEKKMSHMKSIKRLTMTKGELGEKQRTVKEKNAEIKKALDKLMGSYAECQANYEQQQLNEDGTHEEDETLSAHMADLISQIESHREEWLEKREVLKLLKERLVSVDEELADERAELVATSGLLEGNEKLRQKIQNEEREKARDRIDKELAAARKRLDEETQNVRGSIEQQMEEERRELQKVISDQAAQISEGEKENERILKSMSELTTYADGLETRATDAEVSMEFMKTELAEAQAEIAKLLEEKKAEALQSDVKQHVHIEELEATKLQQTEIIKSLNERINSAKDDGIEAGKKAQKEIEEIEKFNLFKSCMETMEKEKEVSDGKLKECQRLLALATQDCMYISQQNDMLKQSLHQAIHYEPNIS